jgi:DNA replication protein DnaC
MTATTATPRLRPRRVPSPAAIPDIDLDRLFKRLHLANTRRVWRDLLERAEQEDWAYEHFLTVLVTEEIAHRQQTRLARLSRRAAFPFLKTIDDFDFTYQSTLRLSLLGSALSPDFVTEGRALILSGKPGRGKTHLAVAIAYRAIQNGFEARFVTGAELIDDLSAAFRAGRLADALTTYTHPDLLVVDEVGYLTYGTDAANMLFHVVNDRHRRNRAMIFTTNKSVAEWGRVLHDEDLAHAIVDRVLERGRLLTLDGPSHRTKHLGPDDPTAPAPRPQVARISGIRAPEFPEPTTGTMNELQRHRSTARKHNAIVENRGRASCGYKNHHGRFLCLRGPSHSTFFGLDSHVDRHVQQVVLLACTRDRERVSRTTLQTQARDDHHVFGEIHNWRRRHWIHRLRVRCAPNSVELF